MQNTLSCWFTLAVLGLVAAGDQIVATASSATNAPTTFVPLIPLSTPRIVQSSVAYPGGHYEVGNLVDGDPRTEYSSKSDGTNTFIEFDFGQPTRIAALRHQDRNDPATVAASELTFLDAAGGVTARITVPHVNQRGGVTFYTLPTPVSVQRIRWRVAALGPQNYSTVGGAELVFYTAGEPEAQPRHVQIETKAFPLLERKDSALVQPLQVILDYPYSTPVPAKIRVGTLAPRDITLRPGAQTLDFALPHLWEETQASVGLEVAGKTVATRTFTRKPVRKWEIHILPQSHVDIGYTALQADVEKKQDENIRRALELIRETKDYPLGARFKWNVEVLWPVENFLRTATPEEQREFIVAVQHHRIGLDALYGNILTGLCRPEELVRSMSYATRLAQRCQVPIVSAMISDVPGYTWSTVTAMAEAGVKYFSFAPNYFDRMGGTMVTWQNQPFWWVGADGKSRVLCWCPSKGYALGHIIGSGEALARYVPDYMLQLEAKSYPYDLTYLRWSVHGDNGPPDEKLADVVRDWNQRYAYPHLVISTTAETFEQFAARYGAQLPTYRGDYTPYWEDGAGSSARETALNRASAERLVQAETLWGIRSPGLFPASEFQAAWRNVLLYSEHTWGAHNSISQPDVDFVKQQWQVKQGFALDADRQSHELLNLALGQGRTGAAPASDAKSTSAFDVFNTCSWERTGLITLSAKDSAAGDRVVDARGRAVPSQRLSTGELVFLAEDVPPLAAKTYRVEAGAALAKGRVKAEGVTLEHPQFTLRLDEHTGAIASFQSRAARAELVDSQAATALNDFFYLPGADLKNLQRNGKPHISIKENGPLVASLLIESEAPGCRKLRREVRAVDGLDHVEIINTIDKLPVRAKEGLHFGFGFNVPDGTARMDVGWAVVRPEVDQIPAACKNWFSVQRWVDIANADYGVTWASVDAPLVEVGGITANLIGSQTNPDVWIKHLPPSQTIYSWVMNNHWHTNYRADQDGPTVFRYYLRPHREYDPLAAAKFGADCSQPLIGSRSVGYAPTRPRFEVSSDKVLVTAFKPSDDGRAWIVRLFGASGREEKVKLSWPGTKPKETWLSDTSEQPLLKAPRSIKVPGWGIATLRVEF